MYDEMNQLFAEITTPLKAQELDIDNPKIYKMVFMALTTWTNSEISFLKAVS